MKNIYRVETKGYEESNVEYGFIVADSYRNAMEQAMEYYGENETEYITLKYITQSRLIKCCTASPWGTYVNEQIRRLSYLEV